MKSKIWVTLILNFFWKCVKNEESNNVKVYFGFVVLFLFFYFLQNYIIYMNLYKKQSDAYVSKCHLLHWIQDRKARHIFKCYLNWHVFKMHNLLTKGRPRREGKEKLKSSSEMSAPHLKSLLFTLNFMIWKALLSKK